MNSVEFHQTLKDWSEADDPEELANKVLGGGAGSPVAYEGVAKQISTRIQGFLNDNKYRLINIDLVPLENLQVLVHMFGIWVKHHGPENELPALETTIEKTIKLVKDKSLECHNRLNYWSEAHSPDELVERVLSERSHSPIPDITDQDVIKNVSNIIQRFFTDNKNQLAAFDLVPLKNLRSLIHRFSILVNLAGNQNQHDNLEALERTVEKTLQLVRDNSTLSIVPDDMFSLIGTFSTMEDNINLVLAGITLPPIILRQSINSSQKEIGNFIRLLKLRESTHPHIFKKMIYTFFTFANITTQKRFFRFFEQGDEHFLNNVLLALPKKMSNLSLAGCQALNDHHIKVIVNRLKRLEKLNLFQCRGVSDQAVMTILNSANMSRLRDLKTAGCPISVDMQKRIRARFHIMEKCINLVIAGKKVERLKESIQKSTQEEIKKFINKLRLKEKKDPEVFTKMIRIFFENADSFAQNRFFINFTEEDDLDTKRFFIHIISLLPVNMEELILCNCSAVTDRCIEVIVKRLNNIKTLNLSNSKNLTDKGIMAIVNSSSMVNLTVFTIDDCPHLSEAVKNKVQNMIMLRLEEEDLPK